MNNSVNIIKSSPQNYLCGACEDENHDSQIQRVYSLSSSLFYWEN